MAADSNDKSTGNLKPFPKGVSGNPGGKNPERERLRRYIVEQYGQEAIDGIAELARDARSAKVKLDALIWLAEQTVGKATQPVTGEDGSPLVDVASLVEKLAKAAK